MAEVITETCANCGRVIGRLETPVLWEEHVVCAECAERLGRQEKPSRVPGKYRDHLQSPRLFMLVIAIGATAYVTITDLKGTTADLRPLEYVAGFFWLLWLVFAIINMSLKAAWKQRQDDQAANS